MNNLKCPFCGADVWMVADQPESFIILFLCEYKVRGTLTGDDVEILKPCKNAEGEHD
jgi:hypothetical protein